MVKLRGVAFKYNRKLIPACKYARVREIFIAYSYKEYKMALSPDKKAEIIAKFQKSAADTGSVEVQVALLTFDINALQEHFKEHKKDNHSRRGLIHKVNSRRKLLDYLKRKSLKRYQYLIKELGLRR